MWVVCGCVLIMIARACQIKLPQKDVDTESVHVSGQDYQPDGHMDVFREIQQSGGNLGIGETCLI